MRCSATRRCFKISELSQNYRQKPLTCSRTVLVNCHSLLLVSETEVSTPSSFNLWCVVMKLRHTKSVLLVQMSRSHHGMQGLTSRRLLASMQPLLAVYLCRAVKLSHSPAALLSLRGDLFVSGGGLRLHEYYKGRGEQAHSLLMCSWARSRLS